MQIAALPRPPELDQLLADLGRALGAARTPDIDRLTRALEATARDASEAVHAMRAFSETLSFAVAMLTPENVAQVRQDGRLLVARLETSRSLRQFTKFDEEAAAVAEFGASAGFVVAPAAAPEPITLSRGAARIFGRRAG